jgi:hypothetical protein
MRKDEKGDVLEMKLMTKAIERKIPRFHEGDGTAYVKFFTPWAGWTWYGCEYQPEEKLFYGYVEGLEKEWGYFSLEELEQLRGPFGLRIERDMYFKPKKVGVTK